MNLCLVMECPTCPFCRGGKEGVAVACRRCRRTLCFYDGRPPPVAVRAQLEHFEEHLAAGVKPWDIPPYVAPAASTANLEDLRALLTACAVATLARFQAQQGAHVTAFHPGRLSTEAYVDQLALSITAGTFKLAKRSHHGQVLLALCDQLHIPRTAAALKARWRQHISNIQQTTQQY